MRSILIRLKWFLLGFDIVLYTLICTENADEINSRKKLDFEVFISF